MSFPIDFYAARSVIATAMADYPVTRTPDAGLTTGQQRKRRASNFMTDEKLSNHRIGAFMVEVSTGTFLDSRLVGLTAFRIGGDRDGDSDYCACVTTVDEMAAHLAKLVEA